MLCKNKEHKPHKVLLLADKHKQLSKNLKHFTRKSSESILKKIEGKYDKIENYGKTILAQLQSKYQHIQQQFFKIHQDIILQKENENLEELSRLDNFKNELKSVLQDINEQLLNQSLSHNLVEQCEQMMSLEKRIPVEPSWRKPDAAPYNESFSKEVLSKLLSNDEAYFESFSEPSTEGEATSSTSPKRRGYRTRPTVKQGICKCVK